MYAREEYISFINDMVEYDYIYDYKPEELVDKASYKWVKYIDPNTVDYHSGIIHIVETRIRSPTNN